MTQRTMYDSVTAAHIPLDAEIVAGYLSGPYTWSAADWARFPRAVHVGIATQADCLEGEVLDVERGDATPGDAPAWVSNRREAGAVPSVYMNDSTWPTVRAAFAAAEIAEPLYWVALYDGDAVVPAGAVAKQYASDDNLGYDLSVVAAYWPGVDPKPVPPPPPPEDSEDTMLVQFVAKTVAPPAGTGGDAVFISNGMRFRHVIDPTDETDVAATGVWFNGGKPVPMWGNAEPVADVHAFGNPDDAHTAALLGLPFP